MESTTIIPFPSAEPPVPPAAVIQAGNGQVFAFSEENAAQQFEAAAKEAGGETRRLVPAEARKTLFELETDLEALQETVELVAPDQQEDFLKEFSTALTAAKDKRDRVHGFMCHLEAAIAVDDAELTRLKKRKARHEAVLDRLDHYVQTTIINLGKDAKGAWKVLEGNSVTLKLKNNPPSVAINDEAAIPARFKTISVTLPAELWEQVCDSLDLELRGQVLDAVKKPGSAVMKTLVKDAIAEAVPDYLDQLKEKPAVYCEAVPGASIAAGGTKLVRS